MLAAALMEWYLQTRTNTPINYKTILLLQASGGPSSTAPEGRSARSTAHPPPSFPPFILSPSPSPPPLSPINRSSYPSQQASPLLPVTAPVSTRRRRTFDHPHSRVISRTIVPSPGLRKYLTLESRERKGRGRGRLSG